MIRYGLACAGEHEFEGWFRSAGAFEEDLGARRLSCPVCGSHEVRKRLMAPAVAGTETGESGGTVRLATADPRRKAVIDKLRELRREVTENAEYVGTRFPEEARRIHYGESEERGIYGEATLDDARALNDEGIEVHPLPVLPDERN